MLQCSEPRDRVFGLVSLLRLSTMRFPYPVELAPDYNKSVVDVYCDATRACFKECDDPWMLDSCGYERNGDNVIEDLPTWVPSWFCGTDAMYSTDGVIRLPNHTRLWRHKYDAAESPWSLDLVAEECCQSEASSWRLSRNPRTLL